MAGFSANVGDFDGEGNVHDRRRPIYFVVGDGDVSAHIASAECVGRDDIDLEAAHVRGPENGSHQYIEGLGWIASI